MWSSNWISCLVGMATMNIMQEFQTQSIKDESERLLKSMKDSGIRIYGLPIDFDNWRMVLVAAYYLGWNKSQDASLKVLDDAVEKLK